MTDQITLKRIQLIHPKIREEVLNIYNEANNKLTNYYLRFAYTLRTFQEQDFLYQQGRTRPGTIVTWAKPGQSYHNYGLAVDICLISPDGKMASWDTKTDFDKDGVSDWMEVVAVFKKYGWEAGIDWKSPKQDTPHFQKTLGYSTSSLLEKFKNGDFIEGTKYVNI